MKTVQLKPNKFATQRTKNRIKENGPTFALEQELNPKPGWVLLKSMTTSWLGWLPIGEIQEINHENNQ